MSVRLGLLSIALALAVASCHRADPVIAPADARLHAITTIFPLYEFARAVAGGRAQVDMLLPPGVEAHAYEPSPAEMASVANADIFVFTASAMEPWAATLLKGAPNASRVAVEAAAGIHLEEELGESHRHEHKADPHVWLDFALAKEMVNAIAEGFAVKDPANAAAYRANAAAYSKELDALDADYRAGLAACNSRTLIHGGHFAFGYLAHRYGLTYRAAFGISPDSDPTPRTMIGLVKLLKKERAKAVFYEEMISPKVAATLADEAGARLLPLNPGHNITREQKERGETFLHLMRENLRSLRAGLGCN